MSCWNCGLPMRSSTFMCRGCGAAVRRSNRAAAQDTSRPTVMGDGGDLDYAGVLLRFMALLVDTAVLMGVSWLLTTKIKLLPAIDPATVPADESAMMEWLSDTITQSTLVGLAINVTYYTVFLSVGGRTIGAYLTGIKVVDLSGRAVFPVAALVRAIAADGAGAVFAIGVLGDLPILLVLSGLVGLIVFFGYLMAFWDSRNQTLHDKIAGTVVVSAGWI